VHQHEVDRQPVQPGGEGRFAAKGVDFAEQEQKGFLSEVFCADHIPNHPQAYCIYAWAMQPVQIFKHRLVAILRSLDGLSFAWGFASNGLPTSRKTRRDILGDSLRVTSRDSRILCKGLRQTRLSRVHAPNNYRSLYYFFP